MVGTIEPLSNLNAVTPDGFSGTFPANPKAFGEALARQGGSGAAAAPALQFALYNPGAQPGEWLTPVAEKASPGAQKPIPAQEGAKPEANRGDGPGPAPLGVCTPAHPGGEREFYTAYRRALGEQWSAHVSGESPLPPAQSLPLRGEMERVDRLLAPGGQSLWGDSSPSEKAYLARQREEQLTKQNDVALSVCGPVLCAGGTLARALGAPEQAVSDAAIVSFNLAGAAAAVPAFRQELGAPALKDRDLLEPSAAKPAAAKPNAPAFTVRQGRSATGARAKAPAANEATPQSLRPSGAGRYGELGADLKALGPDGARAYVKSVRSRLSPEQDKELLAATIAAEESAGRTAALKEFGEDYARLDLREFKSSSVQPAAKTAGERLALAGLLAEDPHLTPQAFARVQDQAQLSNAVYPKVTGDWSKGVREAPAGYEHVTDFSRDARLRSLSRENFEDAESGFHAELYRNEATGKYVLAFPGSQTGKNWVANIKQDLGFKTEQYKLAIDLGRRLQRMLGDKFEGTTGHSKGGGQAAAAAMAAEKPAITFNAAGLNRSTVEREDIVWDESRVTNYRVEGEELTYKQEQDFIWRHIIEPAAGKQITIKPIDEQGRIVKPGNVPARELHGIDYVLRSLLVDTKAKPE